MEAGIERRSYQPITTRAWLTVIGAVVVFIALALGIVAGAAWIYEHATQPRSASAHIISGNEALWRSSSDDDWQLFKTSTAIHEGDELSTELGTVVWVTLFDGSTLEITEGSHVRFSRLRESRFSDATQQVQLDLYRGSLYGTFAPVDANAYGELEVNSDEGKVIASSSRRNNPALSTLFVIEVQDDTSGAAVQFRAAAFRGQLDVRLGSSELVLSGPEQITVGDSGELTRSEDIGREIIANGDFEAVLEPWERVYSAERREPEEHVGSATVIDITGAAESTALQIKRSESTVWARTGVRQSLNQTLRLPADLVLSFDLKIEMQGQPVGGRATIPLALELDYVDILGQERSWTAAYIVRSGEGVTPADAVATVRRGEWTKVIVDLQNLEPIPRTLRTLVVYASGSGYESLLANLSLMVGEGNAGS